MFESGLACVCVSRGCVGSWCRRLLLSRGLLLCCEYGAALLLGVGGCFWL